MRLKSIFISLLFIFVLALSASPGKNDVRYLTGYVKDVNDNLITLSNNYVWRADRHISSLSMLPVVIVLDKDRNEGYMYIKGERVNVTLMQRNNGSKLYTPAIGNVITTYNIGTRAEIETIDKSKGSLVLSNGDVWFAKSDDDIKSLAKWNETAEVIVTKNNSSIRITNVVNADYISVQSASKYAQDKTTN